MVKIFNSPIHDTPINIDKIDGIKKQINDLTIDELSFLLIYIENQYFGSNREKFVIEMNKEGKGKV